MAMGFWRGIIAGSIIGSLFGRLMGSPTKKLTMEGMSQRMSKLRGQAEKVMHEAKDGVKGVYRKK